MGKVKDIEKLKVLPNKMSYIVIGASVFAMHFGGSSMIWPMTWGKESGSSYKVAFLGIFITALFLVFLGYIAIANSGKTMVAMLETVSVRYSRIITFMVILVMGPLFCIPRMSAAAWDAFLQFSKYNPKNVLPALIFSIVYYLITYWFIKDTGGIIDKLSKILLPILIIAVTGVIVKALVNPVDVFSDRSYEINPFVYGFKSGYATAEVICALMFGEIIINSLKENGIDNKYLNYNLKIVCAIGLGILTITHFGHMFAGAHTKNIVGLEYSQLYTEVVIRLWGKMGGAIFNLALLFAALTTAVGLSASTATLVKDVTDDKISYKNAAIIILLISTIISSIGLTKIVDYIGPLIDITYPLIIVLVLFNAIFKNIKGNKKIYLSYKLAMYIAFICGILEGIEIYNKLLGLNIKFIEKFISHLPMADVGLFWIMPVIISILVGLVITSFSNKKNNKE